MNTFKQFLIEKAIQLSLEADLIDSLWDGVNASHSLFGNQRPTLAAINREFTAILWPKFRIAFKQSNRASHKDVLNSIALAHVVGLDGADTDTETGKITIYTTYNIIDAVEDNSKHEKFINAAKSFLSHELVHREQLVRELAKSNKINDAKVDINTVENDFHEYLSDKREIMAFAKQASVELLSSTLSTDAIFTLVKRDHRGLAHYSQAVDYYHSTFKPVDQTYKRFFKYLTDYLEQAK